MLSKDCEKQITSRKVNPHVCDEFLTSVLALKGTIWDYFKDKEIDSVFVYGRNRFTRSLAITALFEDFAIEEYLSKERRTDIVYRFSLHIFYKDYKTYKVAPSKKTTPILVTESIDDSELDYLKKISDHIVFWDDVLQYAFYKIGLMNALDRFKNEHPGVPVVLCNRKDLNKDDASEYEKWLISPEGSSNSVTSTSRIYETVFYPHGYDDEYVRECMRKFNKVQKNGVFYAEDCAGKYVNCINGCRVTTDTPENPRNTVYIFGNSIAFSTGVDDSNTIASHLQRYLNQEHLNYSVMNCANVSASFIMRIAPRLETIRFKPGDIIIIFFQFCDVVFEEYADRYCCCDVRPYFKRPHDMGEIFWDKMHTNPIGYKKYAQILFETMKKNSLFKKEHDEPTNIDELPCKTQVGEMENALSHSDTENEELNQYIEHLKIDYPPVKTKTGAIVMNCNPFTLGHRYLIEYAASKVERLYIFVVEEDKSIFPFKDRLELVKAGTVDLPNVVVVPSGKFIISSLTFPDYFCKSEIQSYTIDSSQDVTIFAEKIAPALNISIRFAGEEPIDNITRQYNATMRMILPQYNINFEIIPRKEMEGHPISASRVRALLQEKNFEEIAALVPQSTLEYLTRVVYERRWC